MSHSPDSGFLLVKHSTGWNVDRCCQWMEHNDQAYDWCYPLDGQPFPSAKTLRGVIIYGGAGSANDCTEHEWIRRELAFIESVLAAGVPFFGICLGAQMLARVLGSRVDKHPLQQKEVGYHRVNPTSVSGDFLLQPLTVMQWHSEGFDIPPDCQCLATGEVFPNQAFRYRDKVIGVQFHPEVNPAALAIWHERNRQRQPGQLDDAERARQMADAKRYDAAISAWLDGFLQRWSA